MSGDNDTDPLIRAAAAVAEGEAVDWESELEATPAKATTLENLRRLEAISGVMRSVTGEEAPKLADDLEEWGHLRLLEELGRGSFGTVYRAFDPTLQRDVAVKLRRSETQAQSAASWIDEARRLARIRHTNVLAVHGADIHDGVAGLWSDLVVGKTLEQTIKVEGQFSLQRTLHIAGQLADALMAVHRSGLVHGDLKPANVMLERDDHVVLMDFGAGSKISNDPRSGSTRIGSPLVMAPEQFQGAESSPTGDTYAFGVLLYRMLTASYPIEAKSLTELAQKHAQGERVDVRSRRRGLPRGLSRLIDDLTHTDPSARPPMSVVKERLSSIANQPTRRRRIAAVMAIIGVLTAGLGVATDAYFRAKNAEADAEAVNEFLLDILASPRGFEQGGEVKVVEVLDQAAERVRTQFADNPKLRARTMFIIGRTYHSLDEFRLAAPFLRETVEVRSKLYGNNDGQVLFSHYLLSSIELVIGDKHEALRKAEKLLEDVQRLRPPEDRYQVLARIRLGDIHHHLGEYELADQYMRAAIALREGEQWRDDFDGNLARLNHATVLNSRGRFSEAEPLAREALAFNLRVNGERNTNTIAARHNLVAALNQLGRYLEAEPLARKNLETAREWLGPESRHMGIVASDLSNTLYHLGHPREALELDDIAIKINQRLYGPDHVGTLMMLVNQGNRYKDIGDILAAESAYKQVNEVGTAEYGESHNLVMMTRYNLSELYYETNRFEQAHELARSTHEIMLSALGGDHLFSLVTESMIGASLAKLGEHEQAQTLLRDTLSRSKQALGNDNDYTLNTAMYLAEDLAITGNFLEARTIALDVVQRRVRMLGPDHPKTQQTQEFVALLSEELQPNNTTAN